MSVLIYFSLFFAIILAISLLATRSRWFAWSVYLLSPVLLTPYWLALQPQGAFRWIKLYSIIGGILLIHLAIYYKKNLRILPRLIYGFLALNIIEAVAFDFFHQHSANAIAGILLILTIPATRHLYIPQRTAATHLLHYPMSLPWIFGYTLWNWTFVYGNFPEAAGIHSIILTIPLMICLWQRQYAVWLQARAYSLGAYLLLLFSAPQLKPHLLIPPQLFSHQAAQLLGYLVLLWMGLTLRHSKTRALSYFSLLSNKTTKPVIAKALSEDKS